MNYVIKQSKTVEDAVEEALLELDKSREDVEIEVLEASSKGLFGLIGAKEAKVKVTVVNDPIKISDDFLNKIFQSMDIESFNEIKKENNTLYIDIKDLDSRNKGILIGKRGSTLDAIQYLVNLAVNKNSSEYLRVIIDIGGYRKKREETLKRLALKMANKSIYSKRPVKLEPMNPYERRVIHSALQNHDKVKTYSEGEDPYRKVVIQSK